MLNQIIIVGRLVATPEVKKLEEEKNVANITVAVPRSYKNVDGEYETDFIDCTLWDVVAENTKDYCHKGDIIAVKGRIQSYKIEKEKEETKYGTEIIAERISFISSNSKKEEK